MNCLETISTFGALRALGVGHANVDSLTYITINDVRKNSHDEQIFWN